MFNVEAFSRQVLLSTGVYHGSRNPAGVPTPCAETRSPQKKEKTQSNANKLAIKLVCTFPQHRGPPGGTCVIDYFRTILILVALTLTPQSDTITIPIRVLSEPDLPGVYLPRGGLVQTTEDSDLVLEGFSIVERDGIYGKGEMEGENIPGDEGASAVGGSWQGKVRYVQAIKSTFEAAMFYSLVCNPIISMGEENISILCACQLCVVNHTQSCPALIDRHLRKIH